jgi:GntR family transcriptional regulator
MSIDRNLPIPLYFQLKQLLLAKIETSELQAGDALPTEQQIQDQYNLSRTTVRQALSELEDEGRIVRQRGRGTFVTESKLAHHPAEYPSLSDNMVQRGVVPGWKLLAAEWVEPDKAVREALQLTRDDEKAFLLERLRLEDGRPIGHHCAYVPATFTDSIDGTAFTSGGSLRYLMSLPFLGQCLADRVLEALPASDNVATLLDVEQGAALFRVKRTIYSPQKVPVEYFVGLYRGDRFEYHVTNMLAVSGVNT